MDILRSIDPFSAESPVSADLFDQHLDAQASRAIESQNMYTGRAYAVSHQQLQRRVHQARINAMALPQQPRVPQNVPATHDITLFNPIHTAEPVEVPQLRNGLAAHENALNAGRVLLNDLKHEAEALERWYVHTKSEVEALSRIPLPDTQEKWLRIVQKHNPRMRFPKQTPGTSTLLLNGDGRTLQAALIRMDSSSSAHEIVPFELKSPAQANASLDGAWRALNGVAADMGVRILPAEREVSFSQNDETSASRVGIFTDNPETVRAWLADWLRHDTAVAPKHRQQIEALFDASPVSVTAMKTMIDEQKLLLHDIRLSLNAIRKSLGRLESMMLKSKEEHHFLLSELPRHESSEAMPRTFMDRLKGWLFEGLSLEALVDRYQKLSATDMHIWKNHFHELRSHFKAVRNQSRLIAQGLTETNSASRRVDGSVSHMPADFPVWERSVGKLPWENDDVIALARVDGAPATGLMRLDENGVKSNFSNIDVRNEGGSRGGAWSALNALAEDHGFKIVPLDADIG